MRRSTDLPLLTAKDVDLWLAGPGLDRREELAAGLRLSWFFGKTRLRRRILTDVRRRWNDDARFRLDVEQSLRALPECLLELARRLAANQLLALASEDSVRRIVAVPRRAATVAFARRVHRELAPLHSLERYPGLLEALIRRLAEAAEKKLFRELRRGSASILTAPRALVLGGEPRLEWGGASGPRGTWWVLETRMSSNDFTRDDAREATTRALRPTLRKLRKELARRESASRTSIGDRAMGVATETSAPAPPPGPRRRRRPQSGVVVVTSSQLDA